MKEFPKDIKRISIYEARCYAQWLHSGNSTGSISEHAILGLADSFARAIAEERERCAAYVARHHIAFSYANNIAAGIRMGEE